MTSVTGDSVTKFD